jgi:predicted nucleic acid-binding protein
MIAADTSSLISFFQDEDGEDVELVDEAFRNRHLVLPPVVLSELLSDPQIQESFVKTISQIPLIEIKEGFWERAGRIRAKVIAKGRKARLADALVAQSCLDEDLTLITRDKNFQVFASTVGLKALPRHERNR